MADVRAAQVPLRRLPAWLRTFEQHHGSTNVRRRDDPAGWAIAAKDGTSALIADPAWLPRVARVDSEPAVDLARLGALAPSYGVLLIRRAGYAVGAFEAGTLVARKVGRRHVHGRTAAGGWSQQRYARRRANQASEIVAATAAHAEHVLGGHALDFLVTGGDRPLLKELAQHLPEALRTVPVAMHLGIGTPDAAVLAGCPDRVLAVQVHVDT